MESLAEAVDAVICEVALTDEKHGKTAEEVDSRKRFIAGASMGAQYANCESEYKLTPPLYTYCRWIHSFAIYNVSTAFPQKSESVR